MSKVELHSGTPFLSGEELNRIARQQELSVVIAKAKIFDQICQGVTLPEEIEYELIKSYLQKESIDDDSELEDYLTMRGWDEADLIYIATKGERLRYFQEQVFSQEVELNYLGRKIDIDQVSYTLICTTDADEAFELHQRLQENEAKPEEIKPLKKAKNPAGIASGYYGPQPISHSNQSLITLLRTGQPGQIWPPFFEDNTWIIAKLDNREGKPLDKNLYSDLLDDLFENWLNQQISNLLTGQQTIELPRFERSMSLKSQSETRGDDQSKEDSEYTQQITTQRDNKEINTTDAANIIAESPLTTENKNAVKKWLQQSEINTQNISKETEDPIIEWQQWIESKCNHSLEDIQTISLEDIFIRLSELFPNTQNIKPKLQKFENVLWIRSSGGLFDGQTGMVIPGTYLCRFPRQRQHPHLNRTWSELVKPITSYQKIEKCFFIPFANMQNFGHFATETVAFLWPFLISENIQEYLNNPVLLNECSSDDNFVDTVKTILSKRGGIPLYDEYLPSAIHLKQVLVPEPTLSLQSYVTDTHAIAGEIMGNILLANKPDKNELPEGISEKIYISRSLLPNTVRKVNSEEEVERHLEKNGWYIFHPQKYPLETQIKVYRQAKILAGFEGSALHCINFIGKVSQQKTIIILGDSPSVDYFFQFRCQEFKGAFIHCTNIDKNDTKALHLRNRKLRVTPKELSMQINKYA